MKNFIKTFFTTLTVSIFLFTIGCKKPNEGVEPIINPTISEYTVSLRFIDAETNTEIKNCSVSIIGDDANTVFDNSGERPTIAKDGFLELISVTTNLPNESNPINFSIKIENKDYFNNITPISIYKKGNQTIDIKMINKSTLSNGNVGFSQEDFDLESDQTLSQEVVLSAAPVNSNGNAVVTIGNDVKFSDANNVVIKNKLNIELAYFNHLDETTIAAFPGGLEATTEDNENIVFKSAGLVSLKMQDADGKIIKNLSKPITMNITIPDGSSDSENKPIVPGTLIPVWSLNEITGKWKLEGETEVKSENGKLVAQFKMNHLSYWNLDFYTNACSTGATLKMQSNFTSDYYTNAKIEFSNGTSRYIYLNLKNGANLTLQRAPQGLSGKLILPEPFNSSTNINSLCSGTTIINVNSSGLQSIKVSIIGKCGAKVVKWPTLSVYAKENLGNNRWEYIGQMVDGNFETYKLKLGKTYVFGTFYNQLIVSDPITIDKTTYQVTKALSATSKACGILTK
jgi:hypothetical protein